MTEPFVVAYVLGVTPGKWARVWAERMPHHPLELRSSDPVEALAALDDGSAHLALVRLPLDSARAGAVELSMIPLYTEQPFVVAPKGHALEALDEATLADLGRETVLDGDPASWAANVELVAANVGVTVLPQSVARALSRRDVIARPLTDAATTQIAVAWPIDASTELVEGLVEEFVGIIRGRTANSSRGTPTPPTPPAPKAVKKKEPTKRTAGTGRATPKARRKAR